VLWADPTRFNSAPVFTSKGWAAAPELPYAAVPPRTVLSMQTMGIHLQTLTDADRRVPGN
jgi:hypothetical protein